MVNNIKNMFDRLLLHKGILVLFGIAVLLVIVIALSAISISNDSPPEQTTNLTTQDEKVSKIQKSVVKKTTPQEIEKLPSLENKVPLPNGSTMYTFASPLLSRKNEVITKDDQVIFERILIPEKSSAVGYTKISEYTKEFGQPQQTVQGSHFYGPFISTLIYADEGFTLIGNAHTSEVYEMHVYAPTTVADYRQKYGEDINENAEVPL